MQTFYSAISKFNGRSDNARILVRNLFIALHYRCSIGRVGDVYTRMDAVYSSNWDLSCKGAIEIEFGRDTLEASRAIIEDIAVMHHRGKLDKNKNIALVICASLPNHRQGYFQVIKDVKNVLGIKIQTITLGALLLFIWNGKNTNFATKEFYIDFDGGNIRNIMEKKLGRSINLSKGQLGILEPEK